MTYLEALVNVFMLCFNVFGAVDLGQIQSPNEAVLMVPVPQDYRDFVSFFSPPPSYLIQVLLEMP